MSMIFFPSQNKLVYDIESLSLKPMHGIVSHLTMLAPHNVLRFKFQNFDLA